MAAQSQRGAGQISDQQYQQLERSTEELQDAVEDILDADCPEEYKKAQAKIIVELRTIISILL